MVFEFECIFGTVPFLPFPRNVHKITLRWMCWIRQKKSACKYLHETKDELELKTSVKSTVYQQTQESLAKWRRPERKMHCSRLLNGECQCIQFLMNFAASAEMAKKKRCGKKYWLSFDSFMRIHAPAIFSIYKHVFVRYCIFLVLTSDSSGIKTIKPKLVWIIY